MAAPPGPPPTLGRGRVLLAIVVVAAAAAVHLVAIDPPLGHDEAVYALGGRALVGHGPASGFAAYRSWGMRLVAAPGVLLGGDERALRALPVLLGLGFLLASCGFAARRGGVAAAALLGGAALGWSQLARHATYLLSDVPSSLALLGCFVALDELRAPAAPAIRWRLVAAAAGCAVAAFWLRYGALIGIAAVLVVAFARCGRSWWERRREHLALLGAIALGIAPVLALSWHATGTLTGVFREAQQFAGNPAPGHGLVTYLALWFRADDGISSPLVGALAVIGVAGAIIAGFKRDPGRGLRATLVATAILEIVWLGLTAHAEPRYVFFPVMLLAIAGALATTSWLARAPRRAQQGATLALTLACAVSATRGHLVDVRYAGKAGRDDALIAHARAIRGDAAGAPCEVLTSDIPLTSWYAGCAARLVPDRVAPAELAADRRLYLLLVDHPRRPAPPLAALIPRGFAARVVLATGPPGHASRTYRVDRAGR